MSATTGRLGVLPLHLGGFIGPFGGAVLAVLIPELRDAFDATTGEVALAVPAYLVPFAVLMLVSGTYGERLGRRRTVRVAYLGYAVASLVAAVAPTIEVFLAGRALQGIANAFTTPLVMAGLADAVPRERLGRSIGTFAGVQAAAVSSAPLLGGLLAAAFSWHAAFVATAVIALALALVPPPDGAATATTPPRLRDLVTVRVGRLALCAVAGYLGFTGLPFIVSLRIDDAFGLDATMRGVVLACYGAAGFAFGTYGGRLVERHGARRATAAGAVAGATSVALLALASTPLALAVVWTLGGAVSALLWAGLNTLAVETSDTNRAGVVSAYQSFKFVGAAAAPLLLLPVYDRSVALTFLLAAAITLVAAVAAPPDRRR